MGCARPHVVGWPRLAVAQTRLPPSADMRRCARSSATPGPPIRRAWRRARWQRRLRENKRDRIVSKSSEIDCQSHGCSWRKNENDDRDRCVKAINETTDDASKLKTLEASGLGDCVTARRNVLTAALDKIRSALACDGPKPQPGCGVTFRYIIQVNRN